MPQLHPDRVTTAPGTERTLEGMSTAVRPRPHAGASSDQATDVLVVFGISGDLARVMTFRSLYRLERRGLLQCPILGVAADDWTDDDLRAHARAAIEACGETIDEATFARFAARLSYLAGNFAEPATFERVARALDGEGAPGLLPRDPAVAVRDGRRRPGRRGPDRARARRGREAVRPRPRVGARAAGRARGPPARGAALPDRPLPREDGARRDPLPAVRERDLRADLEPQLRLVRADHDGRGLRRRRPRALLRPGRGAARRRRQPPDAGRRRGRDGAAGGHRPAHAEGLDRGRPARHPRRRPRPLRARTARGLHGDQRRGAGLADRDLRRAAPGHRELALGRRAVLHPHRQVPAHDPDRGAPRVPAAAAAGRPPRGRAARPSPTRSSSSSTRRPASAWSSTPSAATAASPSASRWTWSSPTRAARARRPTRSCSAPRCAATRCASRARTPSRSSGGSCSRCSTRRRRCTRTRRARWGPEAGDRLPDGYGGWHGPWVAS